jgi:very-short-patch-repair endonuclease
VPAIPTQLPRLEADSSSVSRLLRPRTHRARALRREETPAERELWRWLRGRKLEGAKFRRQQPLGPFVVDFFCQEAWLVVEADGASHFPTPVRDHTRDLWLAAAGITVLRFENCQILHHTAAVLERIRKAIQSSRLP